MKIVTIIGARPQFVKAAVISRVIAFHNGRAAGKKIEEIILHTGQHYDHNMSGVFFREMQIPEADYNLGISDCSHGAMTGRMLEQIEKILTDERPEVVLVYGDTNSTLAGALAAAKLHIPVAHVEAGLRSFNMDMPEEINRVMTDRVSSFLFCPTDTAIKNLSDEGIRDNAKILPRATVVRNVGDVMYDATMFYKEMARPSRNVHEIICAANRNYYLSTIHREENTDNSDRLRNIFEALEAIAKTTPVVMPLHPRTKKAIAGLGMKLSNIKFIDPVGYFDMLLLLDSCRAVFTDSGGLQKEAYFFKKPCMTLRDQTEWVELVEHGFNTLVRAEKETIIAAEKNIAFAALDDSGRLYGRGDAGVRIIRTLAEQAG